MKMPVPQRFSRRQPGCPPADRAGNTRKTRAGSRATGAWPYNPSGVLLVVERWCRDIAERRLREVRGFFGVLERLAGAMIFGGGEVHSALARVLYFPSSNPSTKKDYTIDESLLL